MTIEAQVKEKLKILRTKCDRFPFLQQVEDTINIPKEYVALLTGVLVVVLVFFGMGAGSLCNMVGFVYPAWKSFQTIENKNRADDTQWLVYWIVYAFFSIIEVFNDILLYWIPFYYAFKLAFLLWAMLPQTKGAKFLYDSFLKDLLKKNESKLDSALNDAKRSASTAASEVAAASSELKESAAKASEYVKSKSKAAKPEEETETEGESKKDD